jgi:hypothetical protein
MGAMDAFGALKSASPSDPLGICQPAHGTSLEYLAEVFTWTVKSRPEKFAQSDSAILPMITTLKSAFPCKK